MDARTLSHDLVDRVATLRPILATFMGVAGHDHRWDDLGPAGAARWCELLVDTRRALDALGPPADRWDALAGAVLRDWCALEEAHHAHGDHRRELNSIASPFQYLRMVFDLMPTDTAGGWDAVCARLEGMPRAVESYRALLAEGLALGELVAARQARAAVQQGRIATADDGFYRGLAATLAASEHATPERTERLGAGIRAARGAVTGLADWIEASYLPRCPVADAVGRTRYVRAARRFLGTSIDPEESYAWGWTEVRGLLESMGAVAQQIAPGVPLPEVLRRLREDGVCTAPDAESFLREMQARQERCLAALDGVHFDVPAPIRRIVVRRAPRGSGPLGAYYVPPSEDLSRPGTVWYQLEGDGPVPLFDEVSTAYHEGFPGHHLQVGIQVTLREHLSRWQRLGDGYAGYAEGWALYTERLMHELGFYERPEYVLGMFANQLVRALRVVIDIGLHLELPIPMDAPFLAGEPWSFERAVEALCTHGGLSRAHAESEVTRYLGWPGQAISYKLGERAILALRETWRSMDAGSLKDFHARVLGCGPVGLDRLREVVLGDGLNFSTSHPQPGNKH